MTVRKYLNSCENNIVPTDEKTAKEGSKKIRKLIFLKSKYKNL